MVKEDIMTVWYFTSTWKKGFFLGEWEWKDRKKDRSMPYLSLEIDIGTTLNEEFADINWTIVRGDVEGCETRLEGGNKVRNIVKDP